MSLPRVTLEEIPASEDVRGEEEVVDVEGQRAGAVTGPGIKRIQRRRPRDSAENHQIVVAENKRGISSFSPEVFK